VTPQTARKTLLGIAVCSAAGAAALWPHRLAEQLIAPAVLAAAILAAIWAGEWRLRRRPFRPRG
jgi:hypothetical protein